MCPHSAENLIKIEEHDIYNRSKDIISMGEISLADIKVTENLKSRNVEIKKSYEI
jgi:hypothetical protein